MAKVDFSGWRVVIVMLAIWPCATFADREGTSRYVIDDATHPERVDTALVLAVDVSSSIEADERRFQREAYSEALRDPRVANIALGGRTGRVAIAYMEWSGRRFQRVHLPMRIMSSPEGLASFADDILAIEDRANDPMFVQPTAVGDALLAAEAAMSALNVPARDYIIDISGDGVLNDGLEIHAARDHVLAMGLTVNGLPIEVSTDLSTYQAGAIENVARFYMDCVIGGPGAFHLVARGFGDVRETLIMKLMLEMAQLPNTDKARIAAAWNGRQNRGIAQVVPAFAIELTPSVPEPQQERNC